MNNQPSENDCRSAEQSALLADEALSRLPDGDLLDAWTNDSHRGALAILFQRYSRMVLSVCRRRCRTAADVDDAFQSTFLYLAHHAHKIRTPERLPGWLHRVAQRTATATLRLNNRETTLMADPTTTPCEPLQRITRQHDAIVLDEELAGLPESYRSVIVMQVHNDYSLERLAEHFQTTIGVIRGRLYRGKKLLANRLRRRGVVPAVAFAAATSSLATATQVSAATGAFALPGAAALPQPTLDITPLESLFSPGTLSMTVFNTAAAVLVVGTLTVLAVAFPPTQADTTTNASSAVVTVPAETTSDSVATPTIKAVGPIEPATSFAAQFGGNQAKGEKSAKEPARAEAVAKTVFIEQAVPKSATSDLAAKILSMMDDPHELTIGGPLGMLGATMQEQLGIPVIMDARGIKFAEQSDKTQVAVTSANEPLRTVLRKMLSPLGLKAVIEDEGIVITADPSVLVHQGIGTSRWVNLDEKRASKIEDSLRKEIDVEWNELPLEEATQELSKMIGVPIRINRIAFEEIGLTLDVRVRGSFSEMPARDVLVAVLSELDLAYNISANQLSITTIDEAEQNLLNRFYWLEGTGHAGDFDSLMSLIQISVQPDIWEALGGPSTMAAYPGKRPVLLISTTYQVHEQIASMLNVLRENSIGPELTIERVEVPVTQGRRNAPLSSGGGGFQWPTRRGLVPKDSRHTQKAANSP